MCNHSTENWENTGIFVMLDDISIANKENPSLKSHNMVAMA